MVLELDRIYRSGGWVWDLGLVLVCEVWLRESKGVGEGEDGREMGGKAE